MVGFLILKVGCEMQGQINISWKDARNLDS